LTRDVHSFPTRRSSDLLARGRFRERCGPVNFQRRITAQFSSAKGREFLKSKTHVIWESAGNIGKIEVDLGFNTRADCIQLAGGTDRKSTRLNSSHVAIS